MRAMWETAKMSYCSSGRLFMLRWNMMYLQKEYTIHLTVVSHALAIPLGVSNVVKTEFSPQMIYMPIVQFVFPSNINDLLCLSQGELEFCGSNALSEWVTLKACLERSQGDLMDRLGLWLGTNKATFACSFDRWCEPNNSSSRVSRLKLQLNRYNILTGISVNANDCTTQCQQLCWWNTLLL